MKLKKIVDELNLVILSGGNTLGEKVISGGYCSDMLSDVMGNAQEGQIWITMQSHRNVLAVAALKDLGAIILVADSKPEKDTIALSEEEGIPLLGTSLTSFEIAGKLFALLQEG